MSSYDNSWIINALNAGGLSRARRDERKFQQQQQDRQDAQVKWEHEQSLAERQADEAAKQAKAKAEADAAKRTETANRERYYSQLMQAQPQNADRIMQGARAQGIDLPAQPMNVQIADTEALQSNYDPAPRRQQIQAAPAAEHEPAAEPWVG